MPTRTVTDNEILEAALIGLQQKHTEYTEKIADIRRTLGIRTPSTVTAVASTETAVPAKRARRKMSAAARKRIADATRKRWAEFRAKKAGAAKEVGKPAMKKSAPTAASKKAAVKKTAAKKAVAKKATPAMQEETAAS